MKIIEPNIATPIRNPKEFEIEKTELWNSRIGMIGSLARFSTRTKSAARSRPATSRAIPVVEPQPWVGPAHAV